LGWAIQFLACKDLTTWLQRGGRVGREDGSKARATIIAQDSVWRTKKAKKDEEEEYDMEEVTYVKEVEPVMRRYMTSDECLNIIADEHFDNPPIGQCTFSVYARRKDRQSDRCSTLRVLRELYSGDREKYIYS